MGYLEEGLKFLYESELLDDPVLINNLKMNILSQSRYIKDLEMLSVQHNKQLLVYLELGFVGNLLFTKYIEPDVSDIITQLLPHFRIRVVSDRAIFDSARVLVEKALG